MVVAITGVAKAVPVPKAVPPVEVLYQLRVPELAVAAKVTLPVSQRLPGVVPVMVGVAFTVAVTAVLGEMQLPLVAST